MNSRLSRVQKYASLGGSEEGTGLRAESPFAFVLSPSCAFLAWARSGFLFTVEKLTT